MAIILLYKSGIGLLDWIVEWKSFELTPLSEHPKILRYSDHPRTVHR